MSGGVVFCRISSSSCESIKLNNVSSTTTFTATTYREDDRANNVLQPVGLSPYIVPLVSNELFFSRQVLCVQKKNRFSLFVQPAAPSPLLHFFKIIFIFPYPGRSVLKKKYTAKTLVDSHTPVSK